jgi:hypothetical protein
MKKSLFYTFVFFVGACMYVQAQTTHTITLFVDTQAILEDKNTDAHCNFGQAVGISNEDYTIEAAVGDIIVWEGVSTSSPETDIVNIRGVNHEGGVNIFGTNKLNGDKGSPERVTGTVVQGAPGDEDKYKISFKVVSIVDGRQRNKTYHIDPKIRIRP